MHTVWHTTARSVTALKLSLFVTTLLAATLLPMFSSPLLIRAVTDCSPNSIVYSASSWLKGTGVNVCSKGDDSNNYVTNMYGASTVSGLKWECVELVNRLYLAKGWITANWPGYGNTLENNVPTGLVKENQNHISYLNPGDVVTLDEANTNGHAAIINTVGSSSIQTVNQNTQSVLATSNISGSLGSSTGALSSWLYGYQVQAVIHAPSSATQAFPYPSYTYLGTDHLTDGQVIHAGQYIMAPNVETALVLLSNGDLALYGGVNAALLWHTNTANHPNDTLVLQNDGNLVLYSSSGSVLWASNTGSPGDSLVVQLDGNLVQYSSSGQATWATHTGNSTRADNLWTDHLNAGQNLNQYQFITSNDGRYALLNRDNGDTVLYGPGYSVLWHTNMAGNGGDSLAVQNDGNLVLYSWSGKVLWASNTGGSPSALVVQPDGNLVLYSTSGTPIWATNTGP